MRQASVSRNAIARTEKDSVSSRFRLLPVLVFFAFALLTVRLGDIWEAVSDNDKASVYNIDLSGSIGSKRAIAQTEPGKISATMDAPGGDFEDASLDYGIPKPREFGVAPSFSQSELDILQKLAERRETLDLHEREIEQKVAMIEAAEAQIDRKIIKLKQLEGSIKELLDEYNEQEGKKMDSLVKIYSSMKPKDAARIFNELEMPILINVFKKMNARKASAILATMSAKRAKELTTEIAEGNKFPTGQEALNGY